MSRVDRAGKSGRAGDGVESGEAHLERQGAGAGAVDPQAGGDTIGKAHELPVQFVVGVEVRGEGLLVAERLHRPVDLDWSIVERPCQTVEVSAVGFADASHDGRLVE